MWNGLDRSFKDQTHMMLDIHHYAWRAKHLNQTVYLNERDFHKWAFFPFLSFFLVSTRGQRLRS
jgi:hypothetical protein